MRINEDGTVGVPRMQFVLDIYLGMTQEEVTRSEQTRAVMDRFVTERMRQVLSNFNIQYSPPDYNVSEAHHAGG